MKINVPNKNVRIAEDGTYEITVDREAAEWIAREYLLDRISEDIIKQLEAKGIRKGDLEVWEIDEMALEVYDMIRYQPDEDRKMIYINTAIDRYFEERKK